MKRRIFLLVMPIVLAACFFICPTEVHAQLTKLQYEGGWNTPATIVTQTLTPDKNPYYIDFSSGMSSGSVLTIEPGVVIKFGPWYQEGWYKWPVIFYLNGQIKARGTASNPIVFTSIYDDAYAGDSNGDGNATSPAAGDWGGFQISGEGNVFEHVIIKHGGADTRGLMTFYSNSGNQIINSVFENNLRGIDFNVAASSNPVIIENNVFFNNSGGVMAFHKTANPVIRYNDIYNNGSGIGVSDSATPLINYNNIYNNNGYGAEVNQYYSLTQPVNVQFNWWGDDSGPYHPILNPQGKGDRVSDNVLFDPWIGKKEKPDPVIIVPGIMGSWNISGRWQIDPIFHTYDNLVEALIAAGYKENSLGEDDPTLFTLPYDWRQDNNLTANLLKEKIQEIKALTGASKVDIIAHSMGGLVARSYVEGSDYQNDIDQVIFLGTPHQGAVDTYLKYEGAYFVEKWGFLQKYYFQTEAAFNGYFNLVDYIKAMVPTAEQLLPIYNYLKDKQPDNSWQLRTYPLNYPQNTYLENLNSQENINLLKQRVNIINIIGDLGGDSTLNFLRVIADPNSNDNKWQSGYPENLDKNLDSLEMGNGDDTVPLSSANSLNGVEVIEINNSNHVNLPTVMQKEIIKTLTGEIPENYYSSKITSTIKKWLFFRVYSPVDFVVIAPDHKRVGKDFASSTEINEIPDAFYSGFNGQAEFVLIPNPLDGEYKVEIQGVANGGEYTLAGSLIDGNQEISREFSGSIAPEQERDFNITYSAASENPLSDIEPIDTAPPIVVINKPIAGEKYLHSDNLVIDYTATDEFAGIATTTITIDGQEVATTTVDLFDYALGMHNLIITAIDKVGNQSQAQVNFEIIANIDSTISDIKEIYERGWLKKGLYRALLENVFKLLKIEVKYFEREQEMTEKLIKKTGQDSKLNVKQKQKQIEQYNKKLAELKKNRAKAIDHSLDTIVVILKNAKKQNKINQAGYDIIISDINYLRINL